MTTVSVLLPTFNRPKWLAESVRSVLSQEGVDFELLILDNGSGPETGEYIETLASDPRVRDFRWSENAYPWSFLAWMACGKYLVFWTDDDIMEPGNLAKKVEMLEQSGAAFVWSPVTEINAEGAEFGPQRNGWRGGEPIQDAAPFAELFVHNFIPMPSAMFRHPGRDFISRASAFGLWMDWAIWLELSWSGKAAYLPDRLVRLRLHGGSDTNKRGIQTGFLPLYPQIWNHWIERGHRPSEEDWEKMRGVYLYLADAGFDKFKRSQCR